MIEHQSPIGVFDSGVGGLSVLAELVKRLPGQHFIYLADNKNVPYGFRTDEEIQALTTQAVDFLYKKGCKAVVVACNTASAFSLKALRAYYGDRLPIIGLVPAVKPAAIASKTQVIGVLATPGTLRGNLLNEAIQQHALSREVVVLTSVSELLVPLIEQNLSESAECIQELKEVLTPLIDQNIDHLVLGCTHYPFLRPTIHKLFPQLKTIDSGAAVARHTAYTLIQRNLLDDRAQISGLLATGTSIHCYATKYSQSLGQTISDLLGHPFSLKFVMSNSVGPRAKVDQSLDV